VAPADGPTHRGLYVDAYLDLVPGAVLERTLQGKPGGTFDPNRAPSVPDYAREEGLKSHCPPTTWTPLTDEPDDRSQLMPITGLNHAVLYVRDLARSVEFYTDVLGFRRVDMTPKGFTGAAFLQAEGSVNDHDLGLFEVGPQAGPSSAGASSVGLYHLAWEVDTLAELEAVRERLVAAGALVGASDHSTSKSLYGADPDGIEFEVAWFVPLDQIDAATLAGRTSIRPLDLAKEKDRYGATTLGANAHP
jgi:catechol 2,3-dioxygenase-like lactoylglutathione lyase family enzyme